MRRWVSGPSTNAAIEPEKAMPMATPRRREYASASSAAWVEMAVRPRPVPTAAPTMTTKTVSVGATEPSASPQAAAARPVITTARGFRRATSQPAAGPRTAPPIPTKDMGSAVAAREAWNSARRDGRKRMYMLGKPEIRSMVVKASQRRGFARLSGGRVTGALYGTFPKRFP